jgi:ABC-2 type transport system ATP-binding protein
MGEPAVPFLRIDGLRRHFGARAAVDGLSLSVGRGEIFGLLGPNGAGKSTTFHLLTGLLAPDRDGGGRIFVDGREVRPTDPAFRERIGVVFQHPSLDGKLTGRENLRLGAALYGLHGAAAEREIARLVGLLEMQGRLDEPVERYSGGMRRRLELARVLLHGPELLIMDEPGAGLDQASLRIFWGRLGELRRERRMTVLVTTHQPEEAEHCDRLAIVDAGRLVACETPDALRARVGGDVVVLEADAPDALADEVRAAFALEARVVEGRVVIERERGHELIPRLVERFPGGRLRSVSLRRPTLADVFVKLTGRGLVEPTRAEAA